MNTLKITLKYIFIGILTCLLYACSPTRFEKDLLGTWVLELHNSEAPDCDHIVILEFREKGDMSMSKMYTSGHSYSSKWIESNHNNYYILNGRRLYINGDTGNGLRMIQESYIKHIDSLHFYQRINEHDLGGIDQTATKGHYTEVFHKLDTNYPKPLGLWEVISLNGKAFKGFRFEFNENGTYNFWIDVNGRWELKNDNNGTWFSYGDILCTNYFNDIFNESLSYENVSDCYRYCIKDKIMTCTTDVEGKPSFVMQKIDTQPLN